MNRRGLFEIALALSLVMAVSQTSAAKTIKTTLKDAQGKQVGWATIKSAATGVEIKLSVKDLPPGDHAIHIHRDAKCDAPDFKSAGPHFNPDGKQHGRENPDGHHAGDMSNFTVGPNRKADVNILNKDVNLGSDSHSLFSNGGTALVVHAKPDDMKTDPAGNAGDRIACGVIKE